uniref:Uncharacterized protein n=1 Tax=Timema genevievae TaxID=629358 RepID=A0A7R9PLX3_TIMGE|nr:unnamed protein product [Timema genevievae]
MAGIEKIENGVDNPYTTKRLTNYKLNEQLSPQIKASASSLTPSTVVREQYCLWGRLNRLEKKLVIIIALQSLLILVLVILMNTLKRACTEDIRGTNHLLDSILDQESHDSVR